MFVFVLIVIEQINCGERVYDIYLRFLKDRIVIFSGEIIDDIVLFIVVQFFFLEVEDFDKDIYFYINLFGGFVIVGFVIYDIM